ncbi:hypothetical protein [Nostoc sp. LEGE 12450]|uniref:hypothetical protein n=1 Tax=Nostoc sp. LEGE 12450 TaxID=1828643 RepID=UPI0018823185|nr:hypothetical protein [Nostoc sp. LEGE 12450]MBE8987615.1 hypothetical protein [Nostoc sp. LEGE 12450]
MALNIVYLEDIKNPDTWEPSTGALNTWDDGKCVIRNNGEILMSGEASTEPGKYYTENPMNSNGAFRIAFGNTLPRRLSSFSSAILFLPKR